VVDEEDARWRLLQGHVAGIRRHLVAS